MEEDGGIVEGWRWRERWRRVEGRRMEKEGGWRRVEEEGGMEEGGGLCSLVKGTKFIKEKTKTKLEIWFLKS